MNIDLLRMEFKLYFRDIAAVVPGVLLAPVILAVLGAIPSFRVPSEDLGGRSVIALFVPIMLAMAIVMVALGTMPVLLATYRERGILRRLGTTPARPRDLLTAIAVVQLAVMLLGAVLVLAVARLAFGIGLPRNAVAFGLSYLLCTAAVFGLGLVIGSLGNSKLAQGLGMVAYFPMLFFAGLYVPRAAMPETLRTIGDYTPLGAGVEALQAAGDGAWPRLLHLVVLAGYAAIAWIGAVRVFRWS